MPAFEVRFYYHSKYSGLFVRWEGDADSAFFALATATAYIATLNATEHPRFVQTDVYQTLIVRRDLAPEKG